MIELQYPDLEVVPVKLLAADDLGLGPARRDGADEAGYSLPRRLHFGGPLAVPLGPDDVQGDPNLVTLVRNDAATIRYVLVHSALSFHTDAGDPALERASVLIKLSDEAGASEVKAVSLLPQSASTPYETTGGFSLSPSLQLGGAGGSLGSYGRTKTEHGEDFFLRAMDEGSDHPGWKFERTSTVKLDGSYRLVMVVRASATGRARISVTLEASVREGRIFRKEVVLTGPEGPTTEMTF
jgi:hypothetical protein